MSDRPTRLILVRHAEPEANARGRCYGTLDVRLSETGRRRALELGEQLAAADASAVFASPRIRAVETAELVAQARGLHVSVRGDLRELHFGSLEGRRYDEIAVAMPELYQRWMAAPTTVEFPGGESFADLRARAVAAVASIRARHRHATSIVVTHGGVIRAVVADVLELPPEAIFRFAVGYASATVIDWFEETPVVRVMNGDGADVTLRLG